jgi:hypothetical protein
MGMMLKKFGDMVGRRVGSVEVIKPEFCRSYDQYVCIVFEDGERMIIAAVIPYRPQPRPEEMRRAPLFFTEEEVAEEELRLKKEAAARKAKEIEGKKRILKELKKEIADYRSKGK